MGPRCEGATGAAGASPLKIIFLNRYFYPDHSATSQFLGDLAFHLAGRGSEVHVITSRQLYDDPQARLGPRERVRGVQVHRVSTSCFGRMRLPGRGLDYLSFHAAAAARGLQIARPGDVLVAKTDPPLLSVAAAAVAKLRRAVLVNWLQDVFPEVAMALGMRGLGKPVGPWLRKLRNTSLRSAAVNVAVGERMGRQVSHSTGRPVRVIHNWADGEEVRPIAARDNPLREAWGLRDRFVVGYSGNLGRVHEYRTVLEAAERLADVDRIVWLFIGDGLQRDALEQEARRRGLAKMLFRPYQPRGKLAQSLSVPDVHLISLRPEAEGLVVPSKFYGIAAAGRPALFVGDPSSELALELQREGFGYAVPTGEAGMLASRIRALAHAEGLAAQMGARARSVFERRWDRPLAMAAWGELLQDVASRGSTAQVPEDVRWRL
jgi:colanic acid biosynthesis glycosyl transferase WcaI